MRIEVFYSCDIFGIDAGLKSGILVSENRGLTMLNYVFKAGAKQ